MKIQDIYKIMSDVIEDMPTAMEYETDARDVWPGRWNELKKRLMKHKQASSSDAECPVYVDYKKSCKAILAKPPNRPINPPGANAAHPILSA